MKTGISTAPRAVLACLAWACMAGSLWAATPYSDENVFKAQLADGYFLNDFSSQAPNSGLASPAPFSSGVWAYSASALGGFWVSSGGVPTGPSLGVNAVTQSLTITFTGAPVHAVGGYFFAIDFSDTARVTPTVEVVVTFATGATMTIPGASAAAFVGVISGESISKIVIKPTWTSSVACFASVDRLYVGSPVTLPLTGLQAWRQRYFGSPDGTGNGADNENPAGDGIENLMKYAFGLNPTLPASPAVLPRPQIVGSDLVLSFAEPPGISGITYRAEWSSDLMSGNWAEVTDTGAWPQHTFRVSKASRPKLFMRIKITNP